MKAYIIAAMQQVTHNQKEGRRFRQSDFLTRFRSIKRHLLSLKLVKKQRVVFLSSIKLLIHLLQTIDCLDTRIGFSQQL